MSENDICKKDTGRLAKPEDSEPTLDALKHAQEIIDNREARNVDYSEPTVNTDSYTPSKSDVDATGNLESDLDIEDNYPQDEAFEMIERSKLKISNKPSPTPIIDE